MIFFQPQHLGVLPPLLYWFSSCHCGFSGWEVTVYTDCSANKARFMIKGPVGEESVKQSEEIARMIWDDLRKNRNDYRDRFKMGLNKILDVLS
jgi:hypothetical protein